MHYSFTLDEINLIGLTVTEVGENSTQFTWDPPLLVAGETVLGYNVYLEEIISANDNVIVFVYTTQNTRISLDSLDPDREYSICVEVLTDGATEIPTICVSFKTLSLGGELIAK